MQFMQSEQISSTQFADKIGVQRSSVSHILSGRNNPSFDFIRKIMLTYPQIRAEWLIMGEGAMHKPEEGRELFDENEPVYGERKGPETGEKDIVDRRDDKEEQHEQTGIERVVIFYKNNTFTEYHPH